MIPNAAHKILVQGVTGRQGTFWTEQMIACGSNVVGGVNPKKAGTSHLGLPVYGSAQQAVRESGFDIAVMFIPPAGAKAAAVDAIEAGAKMLVCLTEHIPIQDVLEIVAAAKANGTRVVGPNTAGIVVPGECFVGIMPAFNENVFQPGNVGIVSRSGSLGTLVSLQLVQHGIGQSVFYGVGGDSVIGTSSRDALEFLDRDPRTEAVVLCGEIGGTAEEEAAEYAATMSKPVVAFVAGRTAPKDKKMGHAGAIVTGDKGTYKSKKTALEQAGVEVVAVPSQIGAAVVRSRSANLNAAAS